MREVLPLPMTTLPALPYPVVDPTLSAMSQLPASQPAPQVPPDGVFPLPVEHGDSWPGARMFDQTTGGIESMEWLRPHH